MACPPFNPYVHCENRIVACEPTTVPADPLRGFIRHGPLAGVKPTLDAGANT
jgi:hypothetical protein